MSKVWRTLLAAATACCPLAAIAAALTDGSVGAVQSLSGNFTVPQSLGTLRGSNLFHSFTRFGVATGESATFTTGDAGIRAVISRVTGGEASLIQGGLTLSAAAGSRPAFYFVNPSGITVAAGALIDVPAGLHLSTAQQLRFADGFVWDTRGGASSLTVAAPESFGFVGSSGAAALQWRDTGLLLQPGSTFELAAGDITFAGSSLLATGGRVRLQSLGTLALREGSLLAVTADADQPQASIALDARAIDLAASTVTALLLGGSAEGSGAITLRASGALTMSNGAEVSSRTASALPAGALRVEAGSLLLQGVGNGNGTGIATFNVGSGRGAAIVVDTPGALVLLDGGNIFASNNTAGAGGSVTVNAGSLFAFDGSSFAILGSQAFGGSGASGAVTVKVQGEAAFVGGGRIVSASNGTGAAGDLTVSAGSMQIDGQGSPITGVQTFGFLGAPGAIKVDVAGAIDVQRGGGIGSSNRSDRLPGEISVQAGNVRLDGPLSSILALTQGAGPAAAVNVQVRNGLLLASGGQLSSTSWGPGDGAAVQVRAGTIELRGVPDAATGISSGSIGTDTGHAGSVTVDTTRLTITGSAAISADSISQRGRAGDVTVRADSVVLDGQGVSGGIRSFAFGFGPLSAAGRVRVDARNDLTVKAGGSIVAGSLGQGGAGSVDIKAGSLLINGTGANTVTGIGGDAVVFAGRASGAAAPVTIDATRIDIREGGTISSSTSSEASGGAVRINTQVLNIDGGGNTGTYTGIGADTSGPGAGGSIVVKAERVAVLNESQISTSAVAAGRGGTISIDARELQLDGAGVIVSVAAGSGSAGSIDVRVSEAITIAGGSGVVANTGGAGAAGRISVSAGSLELSGADATGLPSRIGSRARPDSGGQPGSITIDVRGDLTMRPGSLLTIANDALVANPAALSPTLLSVRAANIALDGAEVTAASSANARAGQIQLATPGRLTIDHQSLVRTSSVDGDGGPIVVSAGRLVRLRDSQLTTSVEGKTNGNGGDITIASPVLLLESGFVQANTSAPRSRGGNVTIEVGLLVPNGSNVFIGGDRIAGVRTGVAGFNVIQAAAPEGLSGALAVTIPELNLAGSLVGLSTAGIDFGPLGRDMCLVGGESTLTTLGRGALRAPASGPLRVEP